MSRPQLKGLLRAAAKPALMVGGLLLAGYLLRQLGLNEDRLKAAGEGGALGFLALAIAACAVGVPRQVSAYAGGLAFGFVPGGLLALTAMVVACAIDFAWARLLARRWVASRLGGRLARLDRSLSERPFTTALTLRLVPFGSNLILNLLAGVSGVAALPFIMGSALGYIPYAAIFALLGAGVRVDRGAQLAVAIAMLAVSVGLGWILFRRTGHRLDTRAPGA